MANEKKNFVKGIYYSQSELPGERMDVDRAAAELEGYRSSGWGYQVPEDLTPEDFAEIWNQLYEEESAPLPEYRTLSLTVEDLCILRRCTESYLADVEDHIKRTGCKDVAIEPSQLRVLLQAINGAI